MRYESKKRSEVGGGKEPVKNVEIEEELDFSLVTKGVSWRYF